MSWQTIVLIVVGLVVLMGFVYLGVWLYIARKMMNKLK